MAANSMKHDVERMGDLAYAAAMLKKLPRSGFAFLGSGAESIAEHVYGAAIFGFILARMANADQAKTVQMCLFHDFHEAATGDFNYVNHRYDQCDAMHAIRDMSAGTGLEEEIIDCWRQFEAGETLEARLARDADQLDMIVSLRVELARGNHFAEEWLKSAILRLKTDAGKELCSALMELEPWNWWYNQVDASWWVNRDAKSGRRGDMPE